MNGVQPLIQGSEETGKQRESYETHQKNFSGPTGPTAFESYRPGSKNVGHGHTGPLLFKHWRCIPGVDVCSYLTSFKSLFQTAEQTWTPKVDPYMADSEAESRRPGDKAVVDDAAAAAASDFASAADVAEERDKCAPAFLKSFTMRECFRSTASTSGERPKASRTCKAAPCSSM